MATNYKKTQNTAPQTQRAGRHYSQPAGGRGPQKKPSSKAKTFSTIAIIIGVVLLIVAGALFAKDYIGKKNAEQATRDAQQNVAIPTTQEDPKKLEVDANAGIPVVDWDSLRAINPDIIGWLQIPGTQINYPVVQGADNNQYLRSTIRGDGAVEGSIFLDSESSRNIDDQHSIFYGHNIKNGSMFHAIASYIDQGYFDQHRTIYYVTPDKNYVLKALSTYMTDGRDLNVRVFSFPDDSGRTFTQYVQERVDKSVIKASDIKIEDIKHLFEFSTCSYSRKDGRTILLAVEDPTANTTTSPNAKPVNNTEGQLVPATKPSGNNQQVQEQTQTDKK